MAEKRVSPLDMSGFEIWNLVFQNLASAPGSPKAGQAWLDTALNTLMVRIGAQNINLRDRGSMTGTQSASTIIDFDTAVRTNRLDQMAAPTGSLSFNSQKGVLVQNGSGPQDVAAFGQIAAAINLLRLNGIQVDADVNLGAFKLTTSSTPTGANDVTNKSYVDNRVSAAAAGIDWKDSVRTATSANITLSGLQTLNGITLVPGNRVLVKNQTNAAENGVYLAASGAWTRAADAVQGTITAGASTMVEEGTLAGSQWRVATPDPITVGTTALSWQQFGASTSYTADGVTVQLVGNEFRAVTAANGALARHYAGFLGDGSATQFVLNHGWNTNDWVGQIYEVATGERVGGDLKSSSLNAATITFGTAPAANAYRAVLVG